MPERLLYETHSHTPLCKHAVGEPEELAEVAWRRGLKGLTITCHNPMPGGFSEQVRMDLAEFGRYIEMVERARDEWEGRIDVRLGLEADWFPGYEDFLARQLASADFHYVLGSVHPQIPEYRERFWDPDDPVGYQHTYFDHLAEAAETGLFDCLAHPDLVKNLTPGDWEPERILPHIQNVLDRIAETGIAMELNTSGANKTVTEMNPFPAMLDQMQQRGIAVVVGADAHEPGRVGSGFAAALDLLDACGFTHVSYFLNRRRREIPVEAARESLASHALR